MFFKFLDLVFLLMQVMRVGQMCTHPKWSGNIHDGFDIALARLPKPVKNAIWPSLFKGHDVFGHNTPVSALGWGIHDIRGSLQLKPHKFLQMADNLMILNHDLCPGDAKKYLKDHMICTFSEEQNTCKGEQGSKNILASVWVGLSHDNFCCIHEFSVLCVDVL